MTGRHLVGVDLGGTYARAGIVRNGEIGDVWSMPINARGSADEVLDQLCALIDRAEPRSSDGIGVGVPSVVDPVAGIVYDVQNIPAWREVPLKSILAERYGVPVLVNNDANCFALGEHRFGKGKGHRSLVGLIMGTGFAGGIIVDGRLYTGRHGGAGEFGMVPYLDSIHEYYCAGQFFTRRTGQTGAAVFQRAMEDDAEAIELFAEFGYHVGQGIKMIVYACDPEIIVLGGSVRKAFDFFKDAMWDSIRSFVFPRSIDSLKIEVSDLEHAAILGAAALHDVANRTTP